MLSLMRKSPSTRLAITEASRVIDTEAETNHQPLTCDNVTDFQLSNVTDRVLVQFRVQNVHSGKDASISHSGVFFRQLTLEKELYVPVQSEKKGLRFINTTLPVGEWEMHFVATDKHVENGGIVCKAARVTVPKPKKRSPPIVTPPTVTEGVWNGLLAYGSTVVLSVAFFVPLFLYRDQASVACAVFGIGIAVAKGYC